MTVAFVRRFLRTKLAGMKKAMSFIKRMKDIVSSEN